MDWKRKISRLALTLICLGCAFSCSPATPPVPPAELPSALIFPRSVEINVDKIRSGSGASSLQAAFVGAGGTYSDLIASGADLAQSVNELVDATLTIFRTLSIPVSTSQVNYETSVTEDGQVFEIKIDFADYDFDDDGSDEGCAGHTASLPICFRLWINDTRFMVGMFDQYPTEENPGAGIFHVGMNSDLDDAGTDLFFGVIYDHIDSERLATDLSVIGNATIDSENQFIAAHITLDQDGPDATALKTINADADIGPTIAQTDSALYVGQFLEDENYWSGSSVATSGGETVSFFNVCALISTGNEANRDFCLDLGIDVAGIDFVDPVTLGDVAFPVDFPATPTF